MTEPSIPPVEELAKEWLRIDKDHRTRDEIYQLLVRKDVPELESRLRTRIAFGTAGLRARMEAGFSRMNSVTVIQASQGLAANLLKTVQDADSKGVVIGRDGRHNSESFAKLTAAAFVEKGIKVWWYEIPVHTPLVPFGVKQLGAAAGIMITASHNPPQDNGYKVYAENGAQIRPPEDSFIAAAIEQNLEPISWDQDIVEHSMQVKRAFSLVRDSYYRAIKAAVDPSDYLHLAIQDSSLRFAYTAMHGVGLSYMNMVMQTLGVEHLMTTVEAQAQPDPDFPTVKFPNPEEKGALDLAIRTADEKGLALIIANDPDADRLAVAERVAGEWHQYTGNQLGILLAAHTFATYESTHPSPSEIAELAMLSSTVSSRMLSSMAATEGFHHAETLTGFKWLGNVAYDLDAQGYDTRFAFEEAIGYMIPGVVHDKDGIAAGATFLAAAARWRKEDGKSPWEKLQELYQKYGYFDDANTYLISPDVQTMARVFDSIRLLGSSPDATSTPSPYPQTLGPHRVVYWRDMGTHVEYSDAQGTRKPNLPAEPGSMMLTAELDNGVRFTVRASGTEPKIKFYVEGQSRKSAEEAKAKAVEVLDILWKEWFTPEKWGLIKPT